MASPHSRVAAPADSTSEELVPDSMEMTPESFVPDSLMAPDSVTSELQELMPDSMEMAIYGRRCRGDSRVLRARLADGAGLRHHAGVAGAHAGLGDGAGLLDVGGLGAHAGLGDGA